jgi:hypothetical protein
MFIHIYTFKMDVFIMGISLKRQFVLTHTIHQTKIPTLLESWVTDVPSVKNVCPQKLLRIFSCNPNMLKCAIFFLSSIKFILVGYGR